MWPVPFDKFPDQPRVPWRIMLRGGGRLEKHGSALRFVTANATAQHYANAQLDDYQSLPRRRFLWRPPVRLTIRARFSHPNGVLRGTAGFGFWNDPFLMTGLRWPTLPRAVWFFYGSAPSNMKLDSRTPGWGWKAATLDVGRLPFWALLPFAPVAVPLMNIRRIYRAVWPLGQRAVQVGEALLPIDMTVWHTYSLSWQPERVQFAVDDEPALTCNTSPRGPLGFVLWLDNQYLQVTPWGRFGWGLLSAPGEQWLEVEQLTIRNESNLT